MGSPLDGKSLQSLPKRSHSHAGTRHPRRKFPHCRQYLQASEIPPLVSARKHRIELLHQDHAVGPRFTRQTHGQKRRRSLADRASLPGEGNISNMLILRKLNPHFHLIATSRITRLAMHDPGRCQTPKPPGVAGMIKDNLLK